MTQATSRAATTFETTRVLRWLESPTGQYVALALITLLAAALRFYRLGEWSFWIDELYSIRRALTQTEFAEAVARWPPVTTLLIGATLRLLGVTEWSARLVPAVIGILTIPILYLPIRRVWNVRVALIASLLVALSPWHLFWSQNARYYTALMLLCALASLAVFVAFEKNRPWLIAAFYLLLVVAFRERYLALLMVPGVLLYLLLLVVLRFERPPGFHFCMLALLSLGGGGLLLYDAYSLLRFGYSQILAVANLEYVEPVSDPARLAFSIASTIGLSLAALAFFAGVQSIREKNRAGLFLVLSATVPVLVLMAVNPFIFTRVRYAFLTLPHWILLASLAVTQLHRLARPAQTMLAVGVLAALLVDAAGAHLLYYRVNNGNRLDWKGAFGLVRERIRDTDVVVSWWPDFGPYYVGREVVPWRDLSPEDVVESGRRHWFVLDSETIWGNPRMKAWVENDGELIDVRYLRTATDESLRVYLYEPARSRGVDNRDAGASPPTAAE
jgi:4-amino-4-deoxy-L-arabinose transferase-like glycosyltransferase